MHLQLDTQLMPQYLPGNVSQEACTRVEMVAANDHRVIAFTLDNQQHLTIWLSTEDGFVRWIPITLALNEGAPTTVIDFDVIGNVGQGRADGTIDLALIAQRADGERQLFYWPGIPAEAGPEAWRMSFAAASPLDFAHTHPLEMVRLGVLPLPVRRLIAGSANPNFWWDLYRLTTDGSGHTCTAADPITGPGNPYGGQSRMVLGAAVGLRTGSSELEDGAIVASAQGDGGWYQTMLVLPSSDGGPETTWTLKSMDSSQSWPPGLCHVKTVLDADQASASFLFTLDGDGFGNATMSLADALAGQYATYLPCSVSGLVPAAGPVRVVSLDSATKRVGRFERMRPTNNANQPAQLLLTAGAELRDAAAVSVPLFDDVAAFCACRCGTGLEEPTSLHVMVAYASGGIELFTQDSVSEQWQRFRLTNDDVRDGWHAVSSYSTRIQVRDERGAPAVNAAVVLRPHAPCFALINGVATHLSPLFGQVATADGAGVVNLVQPVSALGAAMIDVDLLDSGPVIGMLPGTVLTRAASLGWQEAPAQQTLQLNPMAKATARLSLVTSGAILQNARASDGTLLFAHLPLDRCNEASAALTPLMRAYSATLEPPVLQGHSVTVVARTRLCWQGRRVVVDHHDLESPEPTAPTDWLPAVGDMLGYLWTLVKDTVGEVVTELEWLSNGLASLVLTIGSKVWRATLTIASQAAELIDWALQKSLGITLDDLVNWLGQVFDWPAILRTQQAMKHLVGLHRNTVVDWITNEAPQSLAGVMEQVRTCLNVPAPTTPEIADYIDRPAASGVDNVSPMKPQNNGPDMLWGHTQLQQFSAMASVADSGFPLFDSLLQAVKEAGTTLKQDADTLAAWAAKRDFANANPGDLGKEVLGLIGTGMVDTADVFMQAVLPTLGQAIGDLMDQADQPLSLPVISALYREWINPGQDLTVLDAMTLITAIAGHIGSELATGEPLMPEPVVQRIMNATTLAQLLDTKVCEQGQVPDFGTLVYGYSTLMSGFMKFGYCTLSSMEAWGPPAGATRIRVRVGLDCASWLVSFGWGVEMLRRAPETNKQPYTLAVVFLFLGLMFHRSKDAVDFHFAGSTSAAWAEFKTFFGSLESVLGGTVLIFVSVWQTASTFSYLKAAPGANASAWTTLLAFPSVQALSNASYYALSFERFLPPSPTSEIIKGVRTAANLVRSLCPIAAGFVINDCAKAGWPVPGMVSD